MDYMVIPKLICSVTMGRIPTLLGRKLLPIYIYIYITSYIRANQANALILDLSILPILAVISDKRKEIPCT